LISFVSASPSANCGVEGERGQASCVVMSLQGGEGARGHSDAQGPMHTQTTTPHPHQGGLALQGAWSTAPLATPRPALMAAPRAPRRHTTVPRPIATTAAQCEHQHARRWLWQSPQLADTISKQVRAARWATCLCQVVYGGGRYVVKGLIGEESSVGRHQDLMHEITGGSEF
jgi:hypothetical protein